MHEELEGSELALLDAYRMETAPSGDAESRLWASLQQGLEGELETTEAPERDAANEDPAAGTETPRTRRRFGRVSPLTIALGMAAGALLTLSLKGELAETAQQVGTLPQALMQGGNEGAGHGQIERQADGPAQAQGPGQGHPAQPSVLGSHEEDADDEDRDDEVNPAQTQAPAEAATRTRERVVTRDRVWVPRKGAAGTASEAGSEPRDSRGRAGAGGGGGRGSGGKGSKDGGDRKGGEDGAQDEDREEDEDDFGPIAELCHDEREACFDSEQPEDECEFDFDFCWLELVCPAEFDTCLHEIGDEDDDECFELLEECESEHDPWHRYECSGELEDCLEHADDGESEEECYVQFDECQEELDGQENPDDDETDFEEG